MIYQVGACATYIQQWVANVALPIFNMYFQRRYRVTLRRGKRYGFPPGIKQRHFNPRQELLGYTCGSALATQVVVVLLVPALQVRLQPARGNSILAEPADQHFVLREVFEQVHGESELYFQGALRL
jgi:hypothetical protein